MTKKPGKSPETVQKARFLGLFEKPGASSPVSGLEAPGFLYLLSECSRVDRLKHATTPSRSDRRSGLQAESFVLDGAESLDAVDGKLGASR